MQFHNTHTHTHNQVKDGESDAKATASIEDVLVQCIPWDEEKSSEPKRYDNSMES